VIVGMRTFLSSLTKKRGALLLAGSFVEVVVVVAGCAGTIVDFAVLRRCSDASRVRRSPGIGRFDRASAAEVGTSVGPCGVPRDGGRARLPRSEPIPGPCARCRWAGA